MNYEILEINGNDYPIRFGFNALREYSKITGATMQDLNKLANGETTFNDAFALIYCGMKDGARKAKKEFRYSIADITDLFDGNLESMEEAFEILGRAMEESSGEKKPKAKIAKKKSKKS
tara:strand:+ start:6765 stop:7121 length:357 start_codon:yes stop_codon:yes gene_type:complete